MKCINPFNKGRYAIFPAEMTTICHLEEVHCHFCTEDLPAHAKFPTVMLQQNGQEMDHSK